MRKLVFLSLASVALVGSLTSISVAQSTPNWLHYQGKLTNSLGLSLPDGPHSVEFALYAAPVGGTALWSETKMINLQKGLFSTQLGLPSGQGGTPFPADLFSQALYLGVKVNGGSEIVPRQPLGAAPYALGVGNLSVSTASIANNAVTTAKLADGSVTTPKLADNSVTSIKLASDAGSLAKVSGGSLATTANGTNQAINKHIGFNLADSFVYGSTATGHYSLGWHDNDPQGWTGGPTARLSGYGGIKLFTQGAYRFGVHPEGSVISRARTYIDNGGFGGLPEFDLAIGDTDTGFDWQGDGTLWFMANNQKTVTMAANYFQVHGTFVNSSSRRYKKNIRNLQDAGSIVAQLRPVRYQWQEILGQKQDIGFIAEEVAKVVPEIVALDASGRAEGIDYSRFSAILVAAAQQQASEVKALKVENSELKARLAEIEERLASLEKRTR